MDEKVQIKLKEVLNGLLPNNGIKIDSDTDLRDSPNPAIRDLCETAELIIRLSREERA